MVDLTFRWFSKGVMLMVKTLGLFFCLWASYGFYHGKSPLNYHLGNIFLVLPTIKQANLSLFIPLSFFRFEWVFFTWHLVVIKIAGLCRETLKLKLDVDDSGICCTKNLHPGKLTFWTWKSQVWKGRPFEPNLHFWVPSSMLVFGGVSWN